MARTFVLFLFIAAAAQADLNSVKTEANLERRSELALEYANSAVDDAKNTYEQEPKDLAAHLDEVRQAVELSYKSLQDTGKAARRRPKYFKRAEMRIRALVKRLDNLEREVAYEDRGTVLSAKKRLEEVRDQMVLDIMSKK